MTGMGGATVSRNHAALTNQGAHQVAGSAAAGVLVPVATPRIETVAGNGQLGYGGDGGPATAARLWDANFIAVDTEGDLYIAEVGNHVIRKVDGDTGIITTVAGTGAAGYSGDGGAATAAQLNGPYGITTDRSGNVYWTEFSNFVVRKLDVETGMISTFAGTGSSGFSGDGGLATAAQFRAPWGLVRRAFDNLYITQFDQHVVRKLDARTGIITTIAGTGVENYGGDGGPATAALLQHPAGLVFGRGHTDLYIADRRNRRIRKVGLFALDYDRDNDGLIEIRTLA